MHDYEPTLIFLKWCVNPVSSICTEKLEELKIVFGFIRLRIFFNTIFLACSLFSDFSIMIIYYFIKRLKLRL